MTCREASNETLVGTCGFGLAQADYARSFSCVEVQHTFYQPPQLKTLERWRALMPADFEFVIKAWQLITHDARSPTYRRLKRQLSDSEKMEAGYFRDSAIVNEAWETTLASAKALKARTILFQCPASFTQTAEHIASLKRFVSDLDRKAWISAGSRVEIGTPPCSDRSAKISVCGMWSTRSLRRRQLLNSLTFVCTDEMAGVISMTTANLRN